jgi:hypothetical protein
MIIVFRLLQWYSVFIYEGSCFSLSLSLSQTHTHALIHHSLTHSLTIFAIPRGIFTSPTPPQCSPVTPSLRLLPFTLQNAYARET